MNILVTGGGGFVGANIAAVLAGRDAWSNSPVRPSAEPMVTLSPARVVVADLPSALASGTADIERFFAPVADRIVFAALDVRDRQQIQSLITSERITHIVHAAAITVDEVEERRRAVEIVDANLYGAINVLAAAAGSPSVERVLLLSSSGLYGAPARSSARTGTYTVPFAQRETGPLDLGNLYTITKYSAELLAARYSELTGKFMASLRVPAVYGPFERLRPSRPHTGTLRQLMDALQRGQPITVGGRSVSRDWTYVADIGIAVGALLRAPRWQWSVYNAGCGRSCTFADVVDAFAAHGLAATWVSDPMQADVRMVPRQERTPLDISRLREDTGYRPRYDLSAGLAAWLAAEPLR